MHGKRLLRRFSERIPLPPYGMTIWPDGTPVEAGSRASQKVAVRPGGARPSRPSRPPNRPPAAGPKAQTGAGRGRKRSHGDSRPPAKEPPPKARFVAIAAEEAPVQGRPSEASIRMQALRERVRAKEAAAKGRSLQDST